MVRDLELLKDLHQRVYSKQNVRSSLRVLGNDYKKAKTLLNKIKLSENKEDILTAENIVLAISKIVKVKTTNSLCSFKSVVYLIILVNNFKRKMAEFDIKQANSIVQMYDGSAENLAAFIDSAMLLGVLTTAANKPLALKFLRTKLTGKARLGLPNEFATIAALVADIKKRCEVKTTPEVILARMKAIKEKDTAKLCDTIDELTSNLAAMYMAQEVPSEVAQKMATKAGVETLKEKIQNHDTKLILKAGSFATIQEALQKVRENATSENSSQVLYFRAERGRRNFHYQYNQNHQNSNNWRRGGGPRQYTNSRGRGARQNNNYGNRQNPNSNNNNQNYNNNNQYRQRNNVYVADQGNYQVGGTGGMVPVANHPNLSPNQQQGQVALAQIRQ